MVTPYIKSVVSMVRLLWVITRNCDFSTKRSMICTNRTVFLYDRIADKSGFVQYRKLI